MLITVIGWILALVAGYVLLTQYRGATSIIGQSATSGVQVLKVLQGR